MRPSIKRTIITSKSTGRRYFLVRSIHRPSGRRYYVCSKSDCEVRLLRESDRFCRAHLEQQDSGAENIADASTKSDDVDEDILNDTSEIIDEESPTKARPDSKIESNDDDEQNEEENNGSIAEDDSNEISNNDDTPLQNLLRVRHKKSKGNRAVHVDESGTRTFRDGSGRRRFLCMQIPCTNMLKRQSDVFCRRHTNSRGSLKKKKKSQGVDKRHSAPPLSKQSKKSFRSPFTTPNESTIITTTVANGTNGNHSDEYESPKKIPERTGTNRTFRDVSGKIRFLCSNPACNSRVIRQSDTFCKRHQLEMQTKESNNNLQLLTSNDIVEESNEVEEIDVNHNNTDTSSRATTAESSTKKRKHESQSSISKSLDLSTIPTNKMVIATTTLLEDQWVDILSFLRQFSEVQLSTNLNINNSTTHLLVDDSEHHLHCTITKKIVQAAVRHRIFIISTRWINECVRLNEFIDEQPYQIISDSHTTLRLSSQDSKLSNQYLFNCSSLKSIYAFSIECRQCQGSINRNELIELIELTGAKLFDNEQPVDILIVLCDANEKGLTKIKEKYIHVPASNIKYVTSDFLLKSIIKFEIQDIDKYKL